MCSSDLYAKPNDPVDFAQKLAQLIDDLAQAQAMGKIGRRRVLKSLSWQH